MPDPTLEQIQAALQPKLQSIQDRLVVARQNVTDLEQEEQRHINASNELSSHLNAQG